MNSLSATTETPEWMTVSQSILQIAKLSSLDNLMEQALDAWLEKVTLELRWKVAIDLYQKDEISSGRAAEIAGLNYFVFLKRLKEARIPFNTAEVATAEESQRQGVLIHAAFDFSKA